VNVETAYLSRDSIYETVFTHLGVFSVARLFLLFAFCVFSVTGFAGCSEETKVKKSETVTSPGGKTTTTEEKKVEKSGKNPPPAP